MKDSSFCLKWHLIGLIILCIVLNLDRFIGLIQTDHEVTNKNKPK